jgi:hypothetical protein
VPSAEIEVDRSHEEKEECRLAAAGSYYIGQKAWFHIYLLLVLLCQLSRTTTNPAATAISLSASNPQPTQHMHHGMGTMMMIPNLVGIL